MAFSLEDRVLFGLLAADDADLRLLRSAFDRIEADPIGSAHTRTRDRAGHWVYAARVGHFWLYYFIPHTGHVHFLELLSCNHGP